MTEEILKKLMEYLDSTKDFLLEQTPGVIQDLVTLGIIRNGLYSLGFIIGIVILFYIGRFTFDKANEKPKEYLDIPETWYIGTVVTFLLGTLCVCSLVNYFISFFAAIFAPKAYLIEMLIRK